MANTQTTVPLFVANQVLTAAQQNASAGTGVPVFATTTTRDAAFGGSNKALAKGQLAYIEATDVVQYYNGSAWATLAPTASKVAQVLSTTLTTPFTSTSTSMVIITGLSVSITPTLNTSKILVLANVNGSNDVAVELMYMQLQRDSTAIGVGTGGTANYGSQLYNNGGTNPINSGGMSVLDAPATTSAITYAVYAKNAAAATFYINRTKGDANNRVASTITVMEILA